MLNTISKGAAYTIATIIGMIGSIAYFTSGNLLALPLFFLGPPLAVLIHELGHAIAAWRFGMAVHVIAVGPVALKFNPLRLDRSNSMLGHDVGGHVRFTESRGRYLTRTSDIVISLAGPMANLASFVAAWLLASIIPDRALATLVVGFAFTSLAAFVLSAWPFRSESGRANDALEIVRAIRSGSHRARRSGPAKRSPWQAQ